jgi:hypothetical protein
LLAFVARRVMPTSESSRQSDRITVAIKRLEISDT